MPRATSTLALLSTIGTTLRIWSGYGKARERKRYERHLHNIKGFYSHLLMECFSIYNLQPPQFCRLRLTCSDSWESLPAIPEEQDHPLLASFDTRSISLLPMHLMVAGRTTLLLHARYATNGEIIKTVMPVSCMYDTAKE